MQARCAITLNLTGAFLPEEESNTAFGVLTWTHHKASLNHPLGWRALLEEESDVTCRVVT